EGSSKVKEKLTFKTALGAAWAFTRSGSIWSQQAKLTATGETGPGVFGTSVALSSDGNTGLIGGPGDSQGAGAAWAFTRAGSPWTQQAKLTGSEEVSSAVVPGEFGAAVA